MWRFFFNKGLWDKVMWSKYFKDSCIEDKIKELSDSLEKLFGRSHGQNKKITFGYLKRLWFLDL
jgi:hypothetical protein